MCSIPMARVRGECAAWVPWSRRGLAVQGGCAGGAQVLFLPVAPHAVHTGGCAGHAASPNSGESHFKITLKADALSALTRLERYRKVHAILADELAGPVHALSISFK